MQRWTPERIRSLRHARGETQEEFAKHFRMTVQSVRVWEQDKGEPSGPVTVILDHLSEMVPAAQTA